MKERLKQGWKRLWSRVPPYTRKGKLIRNVVCILVLAVFCWCCLGAPALTPRWDFRREERTHLVGPAEILAVIPGDVMDLPEVSFEEFASGKGSFVRIMERIRWIVVGEQNGFLYCTYRELNGGSHWWEAGESKLIVAEKTGSVSMIPAYRIGGSTQGIAGPYTCGWLLIVQTNLPDARHIRIELQDYNPYRKEGEVIYYTNLCTGTGEVQKNGLFVVPVIQSSDPVVDTEGIDGAFDKGLAHIVITDTNGETIYDEVLTIE